MKKTVVSVFISICVISMGVLYVQSQVQESEYPMTILGGSTAADYKLISFPVKPIDDQDPLTNEAILIDDLGPYDPFLWRFFRWDPTLNGGLGDYIELNQREGDVVWGNEQNIDYGRGYWIISVQTETVNVSGIEDGSNKTIILDEGWNQIGNPFYSLQSNLNVGRVGGPYVPLGNDLNKYTDKFVWKWVGGDYQPTTDSLEVGKGYWIKNITENVVELEFVPDQGLSSEVTSTSYDLSNLDVAQEEMPPSPPSAIDGSSISLSGGSGSVGCFIATAAYLDYDHPNVRRLREFRDRYLLANSFGRMFVDMYYRYSPNLAKFLANRSSMKALARINLMPIIGLSSLVIKMNVYGFLIVLAFSIVMGFFLLSESGGGGGKCKRISSIKSEGGKRKR